MLVLCHRAFGTAPRTAGISNTAAHLSRATAPACACVIIYIHLYMYFKGMVSFFILNKVRKQFGLLIVLITIL